MEAEEEWTDDELETIGARVTEVLEATMPETDDLDAVPAAEVLQARLNVIEGVEFELEWAVQVVEGLRRGDEITIELG